MLVNLIQRVSIRKGLQCRQKVGQQVRCITTCVKQHNRENKEGWITQLYTTSKKNDVKITKLRKQLQVAISSKRSHEKGDLMPYLVAQDLVGFYSSLYTKEDKATFFQLLSQNLGVDVKDITSSIQKFQASMEHNEALTYRYQNVLLNSLIPPYKHLFDDISKLQHGIPFLVNMRADLLNLYRSKHVTKSPRVLAFDVCLKEHLAQWFSNGFLDLDVIKWSESPAALLEKVISYEAVHRMEGWDDLKKRLGVGRRIFSFSHRLMAGEPLVILHTLLSKHVPSNIQDVLNETSESVAGITTACFYSISSTQRGLDGIGLGNLLIKRVVELLQQQYPHLSTFVTLSPVPGFSRWLDNQFAIIEKTNEIPKLLKDLSFDDGYTLDKLKCTLKEKGWHSNEDHVKAVETPLTQLCLRYLLDEKRRGFAIDPVAHFHLRNGASLWRINFLGNTNENGLKASHGFMVNYKYTLNEIESNNNNYVTSGKIAVQENIHKHIKSKL